MPTNARNMANGGSIVVESRWMTEIADKIAKGATLVAYLTLLDSDCHDGAVEIVKGDRGRR